VLLYRFPPVRECRCVLCGCSAVHCTFVHARAVAHTHTHTCIRTRARFSLALCGSDPLLSSARARSRGRPTFLLFSRARASATWDESHAPLLPLSLLLSSFSSLSRRALIQRTEQPKMRALASHLTAIRFARSFFSCPALPMHTSSLQSFNSLPAHAIAQDVLLRASWSLASNLFAFFTFWFTTGLFLRLR
jgi:hypothetical protein